MKKLFCRFCGVATAFAVTGGCGWQTGPVDVALSAGRIEGVTVEPGFAAALHNAFALELRERGIPAGPAVVLRIGDRRAAIEAASTEAHVVLAAEVVVSAELPSRPGCRVEVRGREPWYVNARSGPGDGRDAAMRELARDLASRAIDALSAEAACAAERGTR